MQRHDDVAQLVQHLVRMIAGWHPAVWWLDRQLDFEREVACDEIAVVSPVPPRRYAACLATLAAFPGGPRPLSPCTRRRRLRRACTAGSFGFWRPVRSLAPRPWRAIAAGAGAPLAALALAAAHVPLAGSAAALIASRRIDRKCRDDPCRMRVPHQRRRGVTVADGDTAPACAGGAGGPESPTAPATQTTCRRSEPFTLCRGRVGPLVSAASSGSDACPGSAARQRAPDDRRLDSWRRRHPPRADDQPPCAVGAGGDAGGRSWSRSQTAGVATAGFFSRFGRRVADSF